MTNIQCGEGATWVLLQPRQYHYPVHRCPPATLAW